MAFGGKDRLQNLLTYVTHMWNRVLLSHGKSSVILDIIKACDRMWHAAVLPLSSFELFRSIMLK